jgi:hypothetical protein
MILIDVFETLCRTADATGDLAADRVCRRDRGGARLRGGLA